MSMHHRNPGNLVPKLSLRDLEEIREIIVESLSGLLDEIMADRPEPQPEYLTTREVEGITKYKKATLEALRAKRKGPPFYRQGATVRYRSDEVRAWIEADREGGN
ncbi:helix-turn-helix domain-containing protein [Sulfitobacter sp.]|uniref:helix-turn-helix transcriptional regulator n=1 Tax=Sulfitobacter sp. TaxID=1903071 RepID=UPI002621AA2C|nr:helix-turn-helix domain-containing protein [Sulfitobacter sp.]